VSAAVDGNYNGFGISCNGGTGTITSTVSNGLAPYSYSWSGNGGSSAQSAQVNAGTYTVTITDADGCTATASATITQPAAALSVTASSNSPQYVGGTVSLTTNVTGGVSAYSYSWSGPNGFTSTSANPSISSVTTAANGIYTVVVTDANGCTSSTNVSVIVYGTELYVNDNSTSGDVYTSAVGNDNNAGTANAPFATIGKAIQVAQTGNTIKVDAGTYTENVTVGKSINVLGPNYNVSPNTGSRLAEAIILPSSTNTSSGAVVTITTGNVQFQGFTIDGDNPSLASSGVGLGGSLGTSIDAARTIFLNANGITNVNISKKHCKECSKRNSRRANDQLFCNNSRSVTLIKYSD